ncbi:MAG: ACGX-repeat peptide [Ruthenibacterium lactatiformans]
MALSNLFGWAQKMGRLPPRPAVQPAAPGTSLKKSRGSGLACGAGDKPEEKARGLRFSLRRRGQAEEKPAACGSACGAGDK